MYEHELPVKWTLEKMGAKMGEWKNRKLKNEKNRRGKEKTEKKIVGK